jgi:hypothetical protein
MPFVSGKSFKQAVPLRLLLKEVNLMSSVQAPPAWKIYLFMNLTREKTILSPPLIIFYKSQHYNNETRASTRKRDITAADKIANKIFQLTASRFDQEGRRHWCQNRV